MKKSHTAAHATLTCTRTYNLKSENSKKRKKKLWTVEKKLNKDYTSKNHKSRNSLTAQQVINYESKSDKSPSLYNDHLNNFKCKKANVASPSPSSYQGIIKPQKSNFKKKY